ncbi:uncharacterized protein LAESUDRAFT_726581 [Laetiporus sulphureus 93-53]|uniref:Uncharacterized protein n=1 Tax=Laetiporus sulphureus 93-53 TaxID=1314785 RepID=A0A165E0D8_9APHY|nr:uncharacterized protein LAESUDRAFT_726581 [Laetiporus sulphureus 93-53]KZT06005.1 hypothetical protein LAESUDRAFT_726581 [Laetiporus sulphureus 93-53]
MEAFINMHGIPEQPAAQAAPEPATALAVLLAAGLNSQAPQMVLSPQSIFHLTPNLAPNVLGLNGRQSDAVQNHSVNNHALLSQLLSLPGVTALLSQLAAPQKAQELSPPVSTGLDTSSSAPLDKLVGSMINDENLLFRALTIRKRDKLSVREALEKLHGVNNHTAGSWKDYYLEHFDRLYPQLCHLEDSSFSQPRLASRSAVVEHAPKPKEQREASRSSQSAIEQSVLGRDNPSSQKAARSRQSNHRLERASLEAPAGPSASAQTLETSSRLPGISGRGDHHDYTEEDEQLVMKTVQQMIKQDPKTSKRQICNRLADKTPHRSYRYWVRYLYRTRRSLVNSAMAAARKSEPIQKDIADSHDEVPDENEDASVRVDDRGSERESESAQDNASESDESSELDTDESEPDTDDDEQNMGLLGERYTKADIRLAAKYIVATPGWLLMRPTERRWTAFQEKYPHRSIHAWATFECRYARAIDKYVRKYRRREEKALAAHEASSALPVAAEQPISSSIVVEGDVVASSSKRKLEDEDASTATKMAGKDGKRQKQKL